MLKVFRVTKLSNKSSLKEPGESENQNFFPDTFMDKIFETNSDFNIKYSTTGKSSIFVFYEFFSSIEGRKKKDLGERLSTRL